jgi:4-amino-4-deoxy-L-arabinose transferase-like glycosyltransferase
MDGIWKTLFLVVLILYVVIIALNPSIKNPYFIILVYDNPMLLLFIVLFAYYISQWDLKLGLLLLICAIAIYLDILLIKKGINKENTKDDRAFISYVNSLNSYWK